MAHSASSGRIGGKSSACGVHASVQDPAVSQFPVERFVRHRQLRSKPNLLFQDLDGGEDAPADHVALDAGEPVFDLVELRRVGRRCRRSSLT